MKAIPFFQSVFLLTLFSLFIFSCAKEEMPNNLEVMVDQNIEARSGQVVESVMGSGSFVNNGANRTFSFTAKRFADGTVTGQWQRVNHGDEGTLTSHGVVTCFTIEDNHARLGGYATNGHGSDDPLQNGVAWRVQDNGEGNNNPADQMSFQYYGLSAVSVSDYCDGVYGDIPALLDIDAGNIKVKGQ